jgi:hypothetical protein
MKTKYQGIAPDLVITPDSIAVLPQAQGGWPRSESTIPKPQPGGVSFCIVL